MDENAPKPPDTATPPPPDGMPPEFYWDPYHKEWGRTISTPFGVVWVPAYVEGEPTWEACGPIG